MSALSKVVDIPQNTVVGTTNDLVFNPVAMQQMMDLANIMASSKATIPAHLKGSVGDCFAVIMQSAQFRMNPFAVAQKTFIVNGVLGYEAQLINAIIVNSGVINGRFKYEFIGDWSKVQGKTKELESKTKTDDAGRPKKFRVPAWTFEEEKGLGVRVTATLTSETESRELVLLMTQALTRNSAQWADDPQQQLSYLAVKKWARRFCPDVILGVYSTDELETIDIAPSEKEINPLPGAANIITAQMLVDKIKTMTEDQLTPDALRELDLKSYNDDEKRMIRGEITLRRRALKESAVVATQPPEPIKPDSKIIDWQQLINDSQSMEELQAVVDSLPASVREALDDAIVLKQDFFRSV